MDIYEEYNNSNYKADFFRKIDDKDKKELWNNMTMGDKKSLFSWVSIDDINKLDPEKRNCVICLEDFKSGEKATLLPCVHLFHKNCIKNWLKSKNSCPICKFELTRENINKQVNKFK